MVHILATKFPFSLEQVVPDMKIYSFQYLITATTSTSATMEVSAGD